MCAADDQTAAKIQKRPLGIVDAVGRLLNPHILCRPRRIRRHRLGGFIVAFCNLDIFGDIHQHRTWAARFCQLERFTNGICKVLHRADKIVMFGNGQGYTGDVDFLEAVRSDLMGRHVPRDHHHGYGIQKSGCYTRDQIGCPWTRRCDDHANPPCCAGVSIGGMGGPLFVGGQNMAQLVLIFVEGVIHVDDLPAGVPEHYLAPLLDQRPDHYVSSG